MKNIISIISFLIITALTSNCALAQNTATGTGALASITTGTGNSAFGYFALLSTTTGSYNTGIGNIVLESNKGGAYNVGVGSNALIANTGGSSNIGIGYDAMYTNTTGNANVGIGLSSLYTNSTGTYNVSVGAYALFSNTTAGNNTGVGTMSLYSNTDSNNTALGSTSLYTKTAGSGNSAVGYYAGGKYASYSNCSFFGSGADASTTGQSNATAIGFGSTASSNELSLGNASVTTIFAFNATHVTWSDKRFKYNISEDVKGLDFIMKLRPVVYNFDAKKADEFRLKNVPEDKRNAIINSLDYKPATSIRQSGFIAQEVAQAAKESGYDFNGVMEPKNENEAYRLSYTQFVVPLVKAVQDQQKMIESQANTISQQQQELTNLMNKFESLSNQINQCCSGSGTNTSPANTSPVLFNAVPNPTSGSTVISYYIPANYKSASIQLSDMKGELLQTVTITKAGYSSVNLQLENLSSSFYNYSLIVDDKVIDTHKLNVVLK